VDFMRSAVSRGAPFFLLHSFVHVHTALFSSPRFTNVSQGGRFGDNVEEMDDAVGQMVDALEELGVENDTVVVSGTGGEDGEGGGRRGPRERPREGRTQEGGRDQRGREGPRRAGGREGGR
jgi:hypothetical protein